MTKLYTLLIIVTDGGNGIKSIRAIYLVERYGSTRHVCILDWDSTMTYLYTCFKPCYLGYLDAVQRAHCTLSQKPLRYF